MSSAMTAQSTRSPSSHPVRTTKPYPTTLAPTAATAGAATATAGTLTSITTILAAGAPLAATASALVTVLGAVGISVAVAQSVAYLAAAGFVAFPTRAGVALKSIWTIELRFRAAYILRAAQRLQAGVNQGTALAELLRTELRYFKLHLKAQINRRRAAIEVDRIKNQTSSDLLGWKAVLDGRTTPECRAANGKNFYAQYPPAIGYPGSVHVACRCRPVKAFVGAPLVDRITSPVRVLQAA